MGIHHFWKYFRTNFGDSITNMKKTQNFKELKIDIDNLMIDLNGVFHSSTQKIYKYGNHKPLPRLLSTRKVKKSGNGLKKQIQVFEDVCKEIEILLEIVRPCKRVILCVDGVAPLSKQAQQRSRRFRSAEEKSEEDFKEFDSNCISPGTKFMDHLTKYIDWYIRKSVSKQAKNWKNLEVVFSNEKSPGEGEHTAIQFIRYYGGMDESYCIHGLDADLIMLTLGTMAPKFWVLREDLYSSSNDFFVINIGTTRTHLGEIMNWRDDDKEEHNTSIRVFDPIIAVYDFIFLVFMVGNDFLPHIPSLEITEGGIDCMIDVYKNVGQSYGHITYKNGEHILFNKKSLEIFMGTIAQYDKGILEDKLKRKSKFFPDPILNDNSKFVAGKWVIDMESYRKDYYKQKFDITEIKDICHQYLEGLQWVLSYYINGVPNWQWCFRHHYAPFAKEIAEYLPSFILPEYENTKASTPFQQLLCILPPKSAANLIPSPLCNLITDKKSPLRKFCPNKFVVDKAGKAQEWEGVVILPIVDLNLIKKEYFKIVDKVDKRELRRNVLGQSFIYNYNTESCYVFKSYYGHINCKVNIEPIDL